ncbi:hypothetical protein CJU83_18830 [Acinetobacter baumannii]|nr:hypothetical protein CJU83_18830 [Acinetobacter baumannii]PWG97363.1 hypothetical protein DIZ29_18245 [Acinetobacter baumannii]HAV6210991.1 hypothetical protein [Acinetobacter baumannii]
MFYRSSNQKKPFRGIVTDQTRSQGVVYGFLRDQTSSYTQCSYCGRTLQFGQLMKHLRVWHSYGTKDFIIDF